MAENKKDAFTFSDKIKNSKPAFNPFSKRASSKIGNNGKPKKTLFERTRRDAPFFIAALAALLMLPFLYKYSGSVGEGDPIVAPGMADTVFDPERFDFSPSTEDPSGEIAQLAGRDPLSLIKGWGSTDTENVRYDVDERDGLADYSAASRSSAANRASSSSTKRTYRKTAPAATRAAFKRSTNTPATKINELRGATLNARGGGNIGSRFGGQNLKQAANKNSADPVRNPTKPVSLQPLRAAGAPSRSYFGQDNVARARASRDALSKSDAAQALKDAVFNPIGQGHVGGLGEGILAGGGGAGKMEHTGNFQGITPWWWDMMKQREQEKWNYRYHLWRDPWKEAVKVFGKNMFLCLLAGDAGGDLDNFWGKPKSDGDPASCEINGVPITCPDAVKKYGDSQGELRCSGENENFEDWCKNFSIGGTKRGEFNPAVAGSDGTGFFSQRLSACTGNKWWKKNKGKKPSGGEGGSGAGDGAGDPGEKNNCESVEKPDFAAGISFIMEDAPAENSAIIVTVKNEIVLADGSKVKPCKGSTAKEECVLGLQRGNQLDWDAFKADAKALLKEVDGSHSEEEMFERLLFVRVEGYDGEDLPSDLGTVPVKYNGFKQKALGKKFLAANPPVSCSFPPFQIKAHNPIVPNATANGVVVYNRELVEDPDAIVVSCKAGNAGGVSNSTKPMVRDEKQDGKGTIVGVRVYNDYANLDDESKEMLNEMLEEGETPFSWTATDSKYTSSDSTKYTAGGEDVTPPPSTPFTVEPPEDVELDLPDNFQMPDDPDLEVLGLADNIGEIPSKANAKKPDERVNGATPNGRWKECVADMQAIANRLLVGTKVTERGEVDDLVDEAVNLYQDESGNSMLLSPLPGTHSVAQVLDALTILQSNGTATVSKNIGCAIAKTVGANAKDPHGQNAKEADNNNMFGAFAAFVGPNSSFFPGDKLANGDVDWRFHGCIGGSEAAGGPGAGYHYGHYNWSRNQIGDLKNKKYGPHGEYHSQNGREPYEEVLSNGVWGSFPLHDLERNVSYRQSVTNAELKQRTNNGTIDDINRKIYYDAYKDVFWGSGSCKYAQGETMQIEDLFAYIDILCKEGPNIKPSNAPEGEELSCGLHQYLISPVRAYSNPD